MCQRRIGNVGNGQKGIDMAKRADRISPPFDAKRTNQARKWLGATPLQRTNAWRKLAVSLKPKVSAMR